MNPLQLARRAITVGVDQRYIDAFIEDTNNYAAGSQEYETAMRLLARKIVYKDEDMRDVLRRAGLA